MTMCSRVHWSSSVPFLKNMVTTLMWSLKSGMSRARPRNGTTLWRTVRLSWPRYGNTPKTWCWSLPPTGPQILQLIQSPHLTPMMRPSASVCMRTWTLWIILESWKLGWKMLSNLDRSSSQSGAAESSMGKVPSGNTWAETGWTS